MATGKYININKNNLIIYGLVSLDEPNIIKYVGMTRRNPSYRLSNHIYEAKKDNNKNARTKWISSVDYKITQIILDEVETYDNFIFWEQYWISQIKTWGFDLINSNNGGGGLNKRDSNFSKWLSERNKNNKYNLGKTHTDATKIKISLAHKGKPSPRKGCKASNEKRLKQSLVKIGSKGNATGFKHSEETKNKKRKTVLQLDEHYNILNIFSSLSETAEYFNVSIPTISKVINKNKKYNNFIFKTKIENYG